MEHTTPEHDPETPALMVVPTRRSAFLAALVVASAGAGVIVLSESITVSRSEGTFGPTWWPALMGMLLIVGGAALAVAAFFHRERSGNAPLSRHGLMQLAIVLLLIVGYGVAWLYLHFIVVTVLFLAALVFVTGARGPKALIVFPIVTTAVLYGLFGLLLRVPL
ncbi:tripartite tricarboxylate transporter TctB family protein [Cryobacterium melibiosiphilum]|nr:tripartite tricarboxylate transporter TctB family protein [Cryobacterium melibiosiphilum]